MATKKPKLTKVTKYAIIVAVIVVIFSMYFATQGSTAQFRAARTGTGTTGGTGLPGAGGLPPIQIKQPNLVPVPQVFAAQTNINGVAHCTYTILSKNIGIANAVGTYSAVIYKAGAQNAVGGQTFIGACPMQQGNLAPGVTDSCVTPAAPICTSKVVLTVDGLKEIGESNENDNTITYDIPLANLKPTKCEASYTTGLDNNGTSYIDTYSYTIYTKNVGIVDASNPRMLLSAEKGWFQWQPKCTIASISAGSESSCIISGHILKSGETSKITITADDNNAIMESDETDNVLADVTCT